MSISQEDIERLQYSIWHRRLLSFYELFDQSSQIKKRHELNAKIEGLLRHYRGDYEGLWSYLQESMALRLPPLAPISRSYCIAEAARLLSIQQTDIGVEEIVSALRKSNEIQTKQSGNTYEPNSPLTVTSPVLNYNSLPSWATAYDGLGGNAISQPSVVLLSPTILLRSIYRRKLKAYYTLVDPNKDMTDVDTCMQYFLKEALRDEGIAKIVKSKYKARRRRQLGYIEGDDEADLDSDIEDDLGPTTPRTKATRLERAEHQMFDREEEALMRMWQGVQAAHQFYVPAVDTTYTALGNEKEWLLSLASARINASLSSSLSHINASANSLRQQHENLLQRANLSLRSAEYIGSPLRESFNPNFSQKQRVIDEQRLRGQVFPEHSDILSRSAAIMLQRDRVLGNQRAENRRRIDIRMLEGLSTNELIANVYFQKQNGNSSPRHSADATTGVTLVQPQTKGTYCQQMVLKLVIGGIPFVKYRALEPSHRATINQCIILDLSAIMIPPKEKSNLSAVEMVSSQKPVASPKEEAAKEKKKSSKASPDADSPMLKSSRSRSGSASFQKDKKGESGSTRDRSASRKASAPIINVKSEVVPFDGKAALENIKNAEDSISAKQTCRSQKPEAANIAVPFDGSDPNGTAVAKSVSEISYVGGAHSDQNVLTVPVDASITDVSLHYPSQGLSVTVSLTPSLARYNRKEVSNGQIGGFPPASIDSQRRQQRTIQDVYIPRLMRAVADSAANIDSGLIIGGLLLPHTEKTCHNQGILLQSSGAGIHHSRVRLLDVSFSLTTTIGDR